MIENNTVEFNSPGDEKPPRDSKVQQSSDKKQLPSSLLKPKAAGRLQK